MTVKNTATHKICCNRQTYCFTASYFISCTYNSCCYKIFCS